MTEVPPEHRSLRTLKAPGDRPPAAKYRRTGGPSFLSVLQGHRRHHGRHWLDRHPSHPPSSSAPAHCREGNGESKKFLSSRREVSALGRYFQKLLSSGARRGNDNLTERGINGATGHPKAGRSTKERTR